MRLHNPWQLLSRIPSSIWRDFYYELSRQLMRSGKAPDVDGAIARMSESQLWQLCDYLLSKCEQVPIQQALPLQQVQGQQALPISIAKPITYAPIETALKKPHLMILGETGSGKSTICKYLIRQVNAPCRIIDPHASPTDWIGFQVVGSGRKYDAIGAEFERLEALMQSRYEARDTGITSFEPLIVIIDEFPAIASALGKDATNTVKLLAREARKVSIRLCLLSQGSEVKTLGMEGEGSIRESFAMLRLGNFALAHAKSLKDAAILDAVSSGDRTAMLDSHACNLPTLSNSQALPVLALPSDYVAVLTNIVADTIQPSFDAVEMPSALVSMSAQPKLSAPLQAILDYAQRQNDFVSARKIQSSIRLFRDTPAGEIRGYFQWLSDRGYGTIRGSDDALEFSANDDSR